MNAHPFDEIVAAREEELDPARQAALERHVANCSRCSEFRSDVERIEHRLSRRGPLPSVPGLRVAGRPPRFDHAARGAVTGLTLFVLVVGAVAAGSRLRSAAAPQPSPIASAGAPSDLPARLENDGGLFRDRAANEFVVIGPDGRVQRRQPLGGPLFGQPRVSPTHSDVAFWRAAGDAYELLVWGAAMDAAPRVVARISDVIPWDAPVWNRDATELLYSVGTSPARGGGPNSPPALSRLVLVPLTTGPERVLVDTPNSYPLVAIYADTSTVVAVTGSAVSADPRYITLDARSGAIRSNVPAATFRQVVVDPIRGIAAGDSAQFESPKAPVVRIWPVADYAAVIATFEAPGLNGIAWSAGTLIYGLSPSSRAYEVRALEPRGGSSLLHSGGTPIGPRAVSGDGAVIVVEQIVAPRYALARRDFSGLTAFPGEILDAYVFIDLVHAR